MDEKKFFDHSGIIVTSARFVAPKQTFAMSGITSVKTERSNPAKIFAVAFILLGGIALAAGTLNIWKVAVPFVIGIGLLFIKPSYHVIVGGASGDTKAFNSKDRSFVDSVVNAVDQAIVARG